MRAQTAVSAVVADEAVVTVEVHDGVLTFEAEGGRTYVLKG